MKRNRGISVRKLLSEWCFGRNRRSWVAITTLETTHSLQEVVHHNSHEYNIHIYLCILDSRCWKDSPPMNFPWTSEIKL